MSSSVNRQSTFKKLREAQEHFHNDEPTRAFNLLTQIENTAINKHLREKISDMKVRCLLEVGNIEAAADYIERILIADSFSGKNSLLAANFYAKMGKLDKANRLYMRCICLHPENIQYALEYARFLRETAQSIQATSVLKRCLRYNRRKYDKTEVSLYFLYTEIGVSYFHRGQTLRSLIILSQAEKLNTYFVYYDIMAECYLNLRDYYSAEKSIRRHIEQWGDNDAEAYFMLGKALSGQGKKKQALESLNQSRKLWGELTVTGKDIAHLFPLMQDGSLKTMPGVVIEI